MQWILSLIFIVQMYVMMAVMALLYMPLALFDRRFAYAAVRHYCLWVRWSARVLVGLNTEIRGEVPQGELLLASKHQSFLDIIMIVSVIPRPRFVMKKELMWTPFLGFYAKRLACVPVDRGKKRAAISKMVEDVKSGRVEGGQLVIYPQGTRVAPGAKLPYKVGAGVLYEQTGQTCVPAATNVGVFWPKRGIYRKRGTAVVEFLEPIQPGKKLDVFMAELEDTVETASNALMREAGLAVEAD